MTRAEALALIRLLSAIESWAMSQQRPMPDYLHEQMSDSMDQLMKIVLGGNDDR